MILKRDPQLIWGPGTRRLISRSSKFCIFWQVMQSKAVSLIPRLLPGWRYPQWALSSGLEFLGVSSEPKMQETRCPTHFLRSEFLLPETCLLLPLKQLGPLPSPPPELGCGVEGTYFPETPTSLKTPTLSPENPRPLWRQKQPGPTPLPLPLASEFFTPHFCLKAFSLCEWFSTAFLSNSHEQGGRFSGEPGAWSCRQAEGRVERPTLGLSSGQLAAWTTVTGEGQVLPLGSDGRTGLCHFLRPSSTLLAHSRSVLSWSLRARLLALPPGVRRHLTRSVQG